MEEVWKRWIEKEEMERNKRNVGKNEGNNNARDGAKKNFG